MKSKRIVIYVSIIVIIISILLVILAYVCSNCMTVTILNGLGYGILGSGIVTLCISIGEYFSCRRTELENYYAEALRIFCAFNDIYYTNCGMEKDLLLAYDKECKSNKVWQELSLANSENQKLDAKKALIDFYCSCGLIDRNLDENQIDQIIKVRLKIVISDIEKSINSYIQLSNYSQRELERIYGSFGFITYKGNKDYRNWIYENLHSKIQNTLKDINLSSYHFKMYISGEADNLNAVYQILKESNSKFFKTTIKMDETKTNEIKTTIASFATELKFAIDKLYDKIYDENTSVREPIIIKTEIKSLEDN